METQKQKIISYTPFLLVAVVSVLYHLRMNPLAGDDVFFHAVTEERTMQEFLTDRYLNWTSRIVIDFIVVTLVRLPLLWKLLDCIVFASIPVLLSKTLGESAFMKWCCAAAVLLYPLHDAGSAGWVTTTVNYLWPVWAIIFIGMLLKKMFCKQKIRWFELVIGVFASVIAGSHEQAAVVLLTILILAGIYAVRSRNYRLPFYYVLFALNLISLLFIIICPGNSNRNVVGTVDMPEFAGYTFFDKAYLGLLSIERVFIANVDIVFFSVTVILAVLVCIKTRDYVKTVIGALPVMILLGQSVIRTAYPELNGLFVIPGLVTEWNFRELSAWIPMFYLLVTVAAILYTLYVLLGENLMEYIYGILLLGCGFAAGVVIGFTATIYVSGDRVYITLYFALLFLCLYCIKKMAVQIMEMLRGAVGRLFVTGIGLICMINVGYIWLSCG